MKVEIDRHGMLNIAAETELEAYALRQWAATIVDFPTTMTVSWHLSMPMSNDGEARRAVASELEART